MNNSYTINIADRTGHTTLEGLELDAAVDNIIKHSEENARWAFINGELFEFTGANKRSEQNVNALKGKLEAVENPDILLTGRLVGGKK